MIELYENWLSVHTVWKMRKCIIEEGVETERESSNIDGKREEGGESMPSMEM